MDNFDRALSTLDRAEAFDGDLSMAVGLAYATHRDAIRYALLNCLPKLPDGYCYSAIGISKVPQSHCTAYLSGDNIFYGDTPRLAAQEVIEQIVTSPQTSPGTDSGKENVG